MEEKPKIIDYFNQIRDEVADLPHFFNEVLGLPSNFSRRYDIKNWIDPTLSVRQLDFSFGNDLTTAFAHENEPIKNAAYLHPTKLDHEDFNYYLQQEAALFLTGDKTEVGISLMQQQLSSNNVFAQSPYAGLGHLKEAYLEAKLLADVGRLPIKLMQPEELLSGIDASLYGVKAKIHNAMQRNTLSENVYDEIFNSLIQQHPGIANEILVNAAKIVTEFSLAGSGDDKVSQRIHAKLARANVSEIDKHPQLARTLAKLLCEIDIGISEKALVGTTTRLFSVFGMPDLVISSHANILRAAEAYYRDKAPEVADTFNDLVPDQGFVPITPRNGIIANHKELEVFAHKQGRHRGVKVVPSMIIANALKNTFENNGPIVITGEFMDSITVKELSEKWHGKSRNIALMVNGNASNIEEIKQALNDFINAGCPTNYNLAICLFEKGEEDVAKELFGDDWPNIQAAVASYPNLNIVKTSNKLESAAISPNIFKWAHYNIGKPPGENAFMSAANGCIEACGYSVMSNEQNNMFYNLDKALVAAYPISTYEKWKKALNSQLNSVQRLAEVGLQKKPAIDNFISYLQELDANGFAKKFAVDAYLRTGHLNSLHILLTQIIQLRDGSFTEAAHEQLEQFMQAAQQRFNLKVHNEMQRYFKREYGYSYDELLEIMPQKAFDKAQLFKEPVKAETEKNRKDKMIFAGIGATALAALLAGILLSKKKK